ncbi:hypothetical protein MJH12_13340, partial [bacterium]|nr:hypothetical protein [bacterium]
TYSGVDFEHFWPSGVPSDSSTSVALSGVLTWGQGLFVNMNNTESIEIVSSFHPRNRVKLIEGWNLKSMYTNSNSLAQDQLAGDSLIVTYTSTYEAYFPKSSSNTHTGITSTITSYDKKSSYWIHSPIAQDLSASESIFK